MDITGVNARLRAYYQEIWPQLVKDLAGHQKLSSPLLLEVPPSYPQGAQRLLVVGQETHGWHSDLWSKLQAAPEQVADPIGLLIGSYRSFNRGQKRRYKRSPFLRSALLMQRLLNSGGGVDPAFDPYGFLWSNLFKLDQDQDRPSKVVAELLLRHRILPTEVELTCPTVILFFTGPQYDEVLGKTFARMKMEAVPSVDKRLLARVCHEALPRHSYRTYHPGYLFRARKRHVLPTINALIGPASAART